MALSKAHAGMKAKLAQILTHEEELNQTYEQVEERCVALEERHQQELAGLQAEHLCLKCKAVLSSAASILLFACEETSQIMHAFLILTSHFWRACIPCGFFLSTLRLCATLPRLQVTTHQQIAAMQQKLEVTQAALDEARSWGQALKEQLSTTQERLIRNEEQMSLLRDTQVAALKAFSPNLFCSGRASSAVLGGGHQSYNPASHRCR